jgi:hypothetical protein
MFTKLVTIVVATGFLFGCSSGPTLEEKVDARIDALSTTEINDMCDSYDLFGGEFIKTLTDGLAAQNEVSQEEADLVYDKIVVLCES